uniref:Uncharacterized protein n=1 Tax=Anguilla anguilla TaxID=7936 RepID=A0A0E9SQ79_ANGAN
MGTVWVCWVGACWVCCGREIIEFTAKSIASYLKLLNFNFKSQKA